MSSLKLDAPTANRTDLVSELIDADIVVVHLPDDQSRVLKGHDLLDRILHSGQAEPARCCFLGAANDAQVAAVEAALEVIARGQIDEIEKAILGTRLAGVSLGGAIH